MAKGNERVTNDRDAIGAYREGQKHHQHPPERNSSSKELTPAQVKELNRNFLHQSPKEQPSLRDSFPRDTGKSESHHPTSPSDSQSPTHKPPDMGTSDIKGEAGGYTGTYAGDGGYGGNYTRDGGNSGAYAGGGSSLA